VNPDLTIDAVLVHWGERLFYPKARIVKVAPTPRLDVMTRRKAAVIRQRIRATATLRAPQVMVKVTGGGRGMGAIAAHFRYISKNGKLEIVDDRGAVHEGKEALHDLAEQWRLGGSLIDEVGHRREAFNIMLSMPRGTDAGMVLKAAREFAQAELAEHRYVMVLHEHQANPHVHLSVRAESRTGKRLNPRKTDLHRWRETFAEKLRDLGIDAGATRQATRGVSRNYEPLWRLKAREQARPHNPGVPEKVGRAQWSSRAEAARGWGHIIKALAASEGPEDRALAREAANFASAMPFVQETLRERGKDPAGGRLREKQQHTPPVRTAPVKDRPGPEFVR